PDTSSARSATASGTTFGRSVDRLIRRSVQVPGQRLLAGGRVAGFGVPEGDRQIEIGAFLVEVLDVLGNDFHRPVDGEAPLDRRVHLALVRTLPADGRR